MSFKDYKIQEKEDIVLSKIEEKNVSFLVKINNNYYDINDKEKIEYNIFFNKKNEYSDIINIENTNLNIKDGDVIAIKGCKKTNNKIIFNEILGIQKYNELDYRLFRCLIKPSKINIKNKMPFQFIYIVCPDQYFIANEKDIEKNIEKILNFKWPGEFSGFLVRNKYSFVEEFNLKRSDDIIKILEINNLIKENAIIIPKFALRANYQQIKKEINTFNDGKYIGNFTKKYLNNIDMSINYIDSTIMISKNKNEMRAEFIEPNNNKIIKKEEISIKSFKTELIFDKDYVNEIIDIVNNKQFKRTF